MIQGCPGGTNVITRVLIRERRRREGQRCEVGSSCEEQLEGDRPLALRRRKGPPSKDAGASGSWEGKDTGSSPEPLKGVQLCQRLDHSL